MHHGPELLIVTVLCIALTLGAITRAVSQRTGFPYTVAMMLVGIGVGVALNLLALEGAVLDLLSGGHAISTNLIVFVFLPALVFESAFALDVHAFRKDLGFVAVLAVPALGLSTLLTAGWMMGLTAPALGFGGWDWSWGAALVFGALISATDPVAVVAILRELGAPKRVGLLIEGESLLNDGTAIVIFGVLLAVLSGGEFDATHSALELLRVAGGGVLVGLVLGVLTGAWLGRTFDDASVEITLTIVLAYAAMILAENVFHVSGVLAIVTAGIYLAGPARTRITPSVAHFLHRFWETVAYVANTVIFLLVGLLIAAHLHEARLVTLVVILVGFLGLILIRFFVTFLMRPAAQLLGQPVDSPTAAVMAWGGLRGAVSLALALVVSQSPGVPEEIGVQILTVTAGIVMLTIAVNGTSMGWLLKRLGLTRIGAAEALDEARAEERVLAGVWRKIDDAKRDPALRTIPWADVRQELRVRREVTAARLEGAITEFASANPNERAAAVWRRALWIERRFYRGAYAGGTLSARALDTLEHDLDIHRDSVELGSVQQRLVIDQPGRGVEEDWTTRLGHLWRRLGLKFGRMEFRRLLLRYDVARVVSQAARHVQDELADWRLDEPEATDHVLGVYAGYERQAMETVEDLRTHLPEVAIAIEQRLARRMALGFEAAALSVLEKEGTIGDAAAKRSGAALRQQQKELFFHAPHMKLKRLADLVHETPLFADLEPDVLDELSAMLIEQVVDKGEWLFQQGSRGDAMYIVARGIVEVVRKKDDAKDEEILALLGGGDILGEMALLSGGVRNAGARAASAVTIGRLSRAGFQKLIEARPEVEAKFWDAFLRRALDNHLRSRREFSAETRRLLVDDARAEKRSTGETFRAGPGGAFVVAGTLRCEGQEIQPGSFLEPYDNAVCVDDARLLNLPRLTAVPGPRVSAETVPV